MIAPRRIAIALMLLWPAVANAVLPDEQLADAALEARARTISQGLRCLVCQNEDIDNSGAPLAKDLRILVRERLVKGDSDQQVRDYVVARYGNFVLLKPPVSAATLALWFGPVALLLIGGLFGGLRLRRRATVAAAPPLSAAEQARVETLLQQ